MVQSSSWCPQKRGLLQAIIFIGVLVFTGLWEIRAEPTGLSTDNQPSALSVLQQLLNQGKHRSSDPADLLQLADLYLELGQDMYTDPKQKREAFDEGARLAELALEKDEANAQAHYLYAANLGSSAQTSGIMASAFTVTTLKANIRRALELQPDHAPALHMMGMMLEELPWFLGGDPERALHYLLRAVEVKPDYHRARLDLAKMYLKRQNPSVAGKELTKILEGTSSLSVSAFQGSEQNEARELLESVKPLE